MKKFILKKNLPLAKAGTEVFINEDIKINIAICMVNGQHIIAYIDEKDINEWLEEIPEKAKSIWDLKKGDEFFCINTDLINKDVFISYESFKKKLKFGEVFLTEEEAEKELEKRRAIQRIKKYCWENDIEIEYNREKSYIITYDFVREKFIYTYLPEIMPVCPFYFDEKIKVERIIENCKNDLKIIFDV